MEELNRVYQFAEEHMEKAIEVLRGNLNTLRTGRVSIHVLDGVEVEYYGVMTPLNQVATVNAVDATTIVIQPWDKSLLGKIEKAIQEANLGVNPNNDGDQIRLFFPPMTEEERKRQVKKAKEFGEKAKIAIRNIRREANDKVKKLFKEKILSEDEHRRALERVQEITDKYIEKVDQIIQKKSDEILKI
ncbi:MAG: ribosome recycling factor [Campylobacterales bacterium]